MDIQPAVNFLVGSILLSLGIIVVGIAILILNNLFSKYWKPIKWQIFQPADYTVVDHSMIEELKDSLAKKKDNSLDFNSSKKG